MGEPVTARTYRLKPRAGSRDRDRHEAAPAVPCAMAYTSASSGPPLLENLRGLIAGFYNERGLVRFVVVGLIARFVGFSISNSFAYIHGRIADRVGTKLIRKTRLPQ